MPRYVVYNKNTGEITKEITVPVIDIPNQISAEEDYLETVSGELYDHINLITKEIVKGEIPKLTNSDPDAILEPYIRNRKKLYPTVTDQLDMLFKDVANGLFGESAKDSKWFKHVDQIKNSVPKDGTDVPTIIYEAEEIV